METIPLQIEGYSFGKLYPSKSRGICGESYPSKSRGILLANYAPPNRGVFYPFPIGVFLWQIVPLQIEGCSFANRGVFFWQTIPLQIEGYFTPSQPGFFFGKSYPYRSRGILLENCTPPNRGVFVANRTPPNRGVFFWQTLPLQFEGYLWRIVPLQIEGILLANHTPPNRGVFYPFKKRGYALAFVYNPPWAHPPPLSPPLTNKQQMQEQ